jgi:N6-L-threonylcarbamoyladenine synthase
VAKMLGLGYPGGPIVEKYASNGNASRFNFPRSMVGKAHCDFSFSGLKTAVKRQIEEFSNNLFESTELTNVNRELAGDICASFQSCVGDIIEDRIKNAIALCRQSTPQISALVVAGGVAANKYIRLRLENICAENNFSLKAPPIKLCTDNGAMIAWAGIEKLKLGEASDLSFVPRARWPLAF